MAAKSPVSTKTASKNTARGKAAKQKPPKAAKQKPPKAAKQKPPKRTKKKAIAKQTPAPVPSASTGLTVEASVAAWNFEDAEELNALTTGSSPPRLVVFSRDWTVETIVHQIDQGNIDLDPDFQRRNAWQDERRSRLIESFVLNFPVPQIVLAEHPEQKKSFIVIDGKQRLMTIAGFYLEKYRNYWNKPTIRGLKLLPALNGLAIDDLRQSGQFSNELRQLGNADIRTTVIAEYDGDATLYDIFYRLNTGSVPLSSQELRQVLHRGEFSRYLVAVTDTENPLWRLLPLDAPDPRLRDVELLLRVVALTLFPHEYRGNLKPFLDNAMRSLNTRWDVRCPEIQALVAELFTAIDAVYQIFGPHAARKFKGEKYESQLNRALFEVQVYTLQFPDIRKAALESKERVVAGFEVLCSSNTEFLNSVEATTKSVENYRTRFRAYSEMLAKATATSVPALPM
jgi:hypothetical protein